ncbi:MAG: hypothetical protein JWQ89_510 [Devosia sp.]|uniref:hypothetical protein n=1 Tax=Devosia sp. TaxID=1871048 RepID=UPI00261F7459|nr:hypothetical protein [Devosia sp.]MDB5538783.1 hypothetical protein [Devosia sp.]
MRTISIVGLITLLTVTLAASNASAAGLDCTVTGQIDPASAQTDIMSVLPPDVDLAAPDGLRSAVFTLLLQGVAPNVVLNNLISAYCPTVAADQSLTDAEKTQRVLTFSQEATRLIYSKNAPLAQPNQVLTNTP